MSTRSDKSVYMWLKYIHSVLLPPSCLLCKKDAGNHIFLCVNCAPDFAVDENRCFQCALPLLAAEFSVCGQCLSRPPVWNRSVTAFTYAEPVSGLLHQFKDAGKLTAGRFMTERLGITVMNTYKKSDLPELLIPVPLYPARMRSRGFNQSLEICRFLSRQTDIPKLTRLLRCTRKTSTQKMLNRKQRRKNLKDAFAIKDEHIASIKDRRIALVDDVMTTGSTANELSRLLLRHGAREVHVWTLARTDRH